MRYRRVTEHDRNPQSTPQPLIATQDNSILRPATVRAVAEFTRRGTAIRYSAHARTAGCFLTESHKSSQVPLLQLRTIGARSRNVSDSARATPRAAPARTRVWVQYLRTAWRLNLLYNLFQSYLAPRASLTGVSNYLSFSIYLISV